MTRCSGGRTPITLEPILVQVGGGPVAAVEKVELRCRLWQFVVEEVPCGQAFTVVEIPRLAVRGECLLKPDPGQHYVADGFEVQRGVRQGVGRATVLPEQSGGVFDPLRRRFQRARPAGQRIAQRRCLAGQ